MLPRVTEILSAAGVIEPYGPWVTQWHIDRGTVIHQATVLDDEGDLDDDSLDEEVLRRVNLYREWRGEYIPVILGRETFASHEQLGYCGTYDMLCRIGGERCVVDIKQWPERWHGVQLAAYEALTGGPCKRYALYLGDKRWKFREYTDEGDWGCFLGALAVTKWKLGASPRRGAHVAAADSVVGHGSE